MLLTSFAELSGSDTLIFLFLFYNYDRPSYWGTLRCAFFLFFFLLLPYAVIFFAELKSAGMGGVICGSDIKEKGNKGRIRNRVER